MELIVIGTGSSGNMYVLSHENEKLVLDAGIPVRDLMLVCGGLNGVVGCLVTHEHGDHSKHAMSLAGYGIPIYATAGTIEAANLKGSLIREVKIGKGFRVGHYDIVPFPTQHDAAEPCGFLLRNNSAASQILYATDTYYLRNTFPNTNFWIVECNYCEEIMHRQELEASNLQERIVLNRLRKSHMSLRRLKETLAHNDLTRTRKIVLVHLSDGRSNEEQMVSEIQELTGIETVAADKGLIIDLSITPF